MISLNLSKAQALVLFDFLTRFSKRDRLAIECGAERRVLWDMLADLERVLVEPLGADYGQRLQEAREQVGGEE
ncbi:hypothetical protein [Leptothoe kymatousa]|uniref:Uncharacterized protein n=1 Tax=Leptothoe kymatousa TAU-MAC 1615 TaxID=2364775 RepID=A0ABS5Y1P5_9CYAN|nr:hypothetical protein [Leptothoe kymatousa]MBT9311749.1 hypothetical protein [Leptothoe kymatousa TAU-MAC 1615]